MSLLFIFCLSIRMKKETRALNGNTLLVFLCGLSRNVIGWMRILGRRCLQTEAGGKLWPSRTDADKEILSLCLKRMVMNPMKWEWDSRCRESFVTVLKKTMMHYFCCPALRGSSAQIILPFSVSISKLQRLLLFWSPQFVLFSSKNGFTSRRRLKWIGVLRCGLSLASPLYVCCTNGAVLQIFSCVFVGQSGLSCSLGSSFPMTSWALIFEMSVVNEWYLILILVLMPWEHRQRNLLVLKTWAVRTVTSAVSWEMQNYNVLTYFLVF